MPDSRYCIKLAKDADTWARGLSMLTYSDGRSNLIVMAEEFEQRAKRTNAKEESRAAFLELARALRAHVANVHRWHQEYREGKHRD